MKTMRLRSFGSTARSQSRAAPTSASPKEDEVLQSSPSSSSLCSYSSSSSGSEIEIVSWKSDGGGAEEALGTRSKEVQPISSPLPATTSLPVPVPVVDEARQDEEEKNTVETVSEKEEEATQQERDERSSPPSDRSTEDSDVKLECNNEPSESEDIVNSMDVDGDDDDGQDDDGEDIVLELPAMLRKTMQSNKPQDYLSANASIMTESTEPTSNLASTARLRHQQGLLMPPISSKSKLALTKSQSNLSLESKKSTSSRRSTKSTKSTRSVKKILTIERDDSGQEESDATTKLQRENLLLAEPYSFQPSASMKSAFSKKSVRSTRSTKSARSTRSSKSQQSPLFNGIDPASFDLSPTQSNVSSVGNDDSHSQSSVSRNRSEDDDDNNDGSYNEDGESLTLTSTRSFGSATIGSATYATMASKYTSATLGDQTLGWLAREEEKMKTSWLGRMFGFDPLQAEEDDDVSVVSDVELDDYEFAFDGKDLIRAITGQEQKPTPAKKHIVPVSKFMSSDSRYDENLYDTKEVDRRRGGAKTPKKSLPSVARKTDPFVKNLPAKVDVAAVDAANTAFGAVIPDELPIPPTHHTSSSIQEKSALLGLTEATNSVALSDKPVNREEMSDSTDNMAQREANGTSSPKQGSKDASLFWSTSMDDLMATLTKVGNSFEAKDAGEPQELKLEPTDKDTKMDKKISWDSNVKAGKVDFPTKSFKTGKRSVPKKPTADPTVSVNVYTSSRRGGGKTKNKKKVNRGDGTGGGGLLGFFTGFKTSKQKSKKDKASPTSGTTKSTWTPSRKAMPWPNHK